MQVPTIPANERKEYVCPRCKADYTQLEVLSNVGPMGFTCERCGAILNHERDRNSAGHVKVTRLNDQLKFITDLLLRIDNVIVPDNNFDYAIETALAVVRDEQHQVLSSTVVETLKPTSVKGLADTGPKKIDVKISTSTGPTEEEKEAERLRKEKIALQNALPAWMANSTVSGESFTATPAGDAIVKHEEKKVEPQNKGLDAQQAQELAKMMADLKREQEATAAAAALQKEEDDSDEEEDEFEDVIPTPSIGTPVPASQTLKAAPSPLRQSNIPGKSTNGNGASALKRESPGDDDRPAKKIKVEEVEADDDDEEEGLEFEDV